ncbi:hypothetical protein PCC7418_2940 [Halothece sp. PCC 7418]|uniref:hypothetical protein n=1 Tax=Halothece sp. (strain PCC 7418) TaxID=65093 RepID=UPI0002A07579|nr:hypothetical protein [Halothece sp. PCC 7418]AFZ45069.1 hypothetical protein PCC7418_2940 [Halothece sp. PCC 7418]
MIDTVAQKIPVEILPDPWEEEPITEPKFTHPAWQFPLDPKHEIEAAPAVDGILSPETDPNLLQLPAPKNAVVIDAVNVLLTGELKLHVTGAEKLWQQIGDELTLLMDEG